MRGVLFIGEITLGNGIPFCQNRNDSMKTIRRDYYENKTAASRTNIFRASVTLMGELLSHLNLHESTEAKGCVQHNLL